jgi:peroxiredoxin Q/BCP
MAAPGAHQGKEAMLKEGDKAPDFRVIGDNGEPVALSDYQGRNVVLYFYPKANTPG